MDSTTYYLLTVEYIKFRTEQNKLYHKILQNEMITSDRIYNLIANRRLNNYNSTQSNSNQTDFINEMTGILSALQPSTQNTTFRSTPSFSRNSRLWTEPLRRPNRRAANNTLNLSSIFTPTRTTFTNTERRAPTAAEITQATSQHKYCDISSNEILCAISREEFQPDDDVLKIISCNHFFKKNALITWFSTRSTCPVCRHDILQAVPS